MSGYASANLTFYHGHERSLIERTHMDNAQLLLKNRIATLEAENKAGQEQTNSLQKTIAKQQDIIQFLTAEKFVWQLNDEQLVLNLNDNEESRQFQF